MGTWRISADLLARSRFVVSPRIETVGRAQRPRATQ